MALGIIFGETSTRSFHFCLEMQEENVKITLKFAYVEADLQEDGSRVVARVVDVKYRESTLAKVPQNSTQKQMHLEFRFLI